MNNTIASNESSFSELLHKIITPSDSKSLIDKIDQFSRTLYLTNTDINTKLNGIFSSSEKKALMSGLESANIDLNETEKIENELANIKEIISQLSVKTLFVGQNLTTDSVNKIASWFYENLETQVLIDIQIDHNLIGGVVIVENGIRHDFSLKQQLDSMYAENRFCLD